MARTDIDPALRVRMYDDALGMANAIVLAEYSERAAFAHQALAVKLRELDAALLERDRAAAAADRILRECRDLARHCAGRDDDVAAALEGRIRFIKPEVPRG